ncbi:hypothetical protein GCM10009601_46620 [Streptomyces thermospinosisporus]|uniref:Secreted protein n=1 Tax=Streptomyces thermospinosisporus TaxID=161482 RepID=A0ABP4JW31_9ACTN
MPSVAAAAGVSAVGAAVAAVFGRNASAVAMAIPAGITRARRWRGCDAVMESPVRSLNELRCQNVLVAREREGRALT